MELSFNSRPEGVSEAKPKEKNSICKDQGWEKELILHQGNKRRSEWVESVNKGRMRALRGEVAEGGSLGKALGATF